MKINYIKLSPNAICPTYGTELSAGADLYALLNADVTVKPAETFLVHTGIAIEIPEGYAGLVFARSGLASKKGLAPANKVGVIDADYRGEIMVPLYNHSSEERTLSNGERVAQMIIVPFLKVEYNEVDRLSDTERGLGGFGSTGMK